MSLLLQIVMLLTGMLMFAAPWTCIRKEDRGDESMQKKTRRMGGWLVAAALLWFGVAWLA